MSRTTTQETIDAARKPLTDEEQMVYNRTSRRWLHAKDLNATEALLETLVDKGWLDKTRFDGGWVYQRVHSLDEVDYERR